MTNQNKNYLFIDGGGTKIAGYLYDQSFKNAYSLKLDTMANLFVSEEITQKSFEKLQEGFKDIHIDSVFVSLAGYSQELESHNKFKQYVKELFKTENITIYNDIEFITRAFCNDEKSLMVIMGTGSAYGYLKNTKFNLIGGWGHIFGDEGSAYSFAKEIIKLALNDMDLEKSTTISNIVQNYFNAHTKDEMKLELYKDTAKGRIAKLAQHVLSQEYNDEDEIIISNLLMNEVENIKIKLDGFIDSFETIYIDGGFAKNDKIFTAFKTVFNNKEIKRISWTDEGDNNPIFRIIKNKE